MKSKHAWPIIVYLAVGLYFSYRYSALSSLGILMIGVTHELGHYMCAVIKGKDPRFIYRGGNFGVAYSRKAGERSLFITSGGMIVNFLFLPLFVGMEVLDMNALWIALLIIGGSIRDIVHIVKDLRKSVNHC